MFFPPETDAKRLELDIKAVGNYFWTFLKLFEAGKKRAASPVSFIISRSKHEARKAGAYQLVSGHKP